MTTQTVTADDLDALRHTLGAEPERARKSWGFRNYYVGKTPAMERLVAAGFAEIFCYNPKTEGEPEPVYRATREGCRAVGMTDKEITRMERDR